MTPPLHPPLNGRNLAEYYVASEASKLSTLREYAKPPDEQQARILMYDPIRKCVREYFRSGRDLKVLERASNFHKQRHFANPDYEATYHKSNEAALDNLRSIKLRGEFHDVVGANAAMHSNGMRILSTADFYARYMPKAANGKERQVAVIVNPSKIAGSAEKRKALIKVESEVAFQAAVSSGMTIDEVLYLDLQRQDVYWHEGPKKTIKAEIDATCYRLVRDWREIRIEMTRGGEGTA